MATSLANRASLFSQLENQYGLPGGLLEAVMQAESSGNLNAVSPVGALGPFQLMPGTARELGVTDPRDLDQAATGAARYLQQQLNRFGSLDSALAAYNWGPGNLSKKGYDARPTETRNYVNKVLGSLGASPGDGSIDVANSLLGKVSTLQQGSTAATMDIMQAYGLSSMAATKAAELNREAASAQENAALVAAQGELATQKARIEAANAFGTNVQAQSEIMTAIGTQMRDSALALIEQQQKVSAIQNNATLTNPLGLFYDILYGDGERNKLAGMQAQFDTLSGVAQNLNAATQQTAQTQNAIKQTLTEASIADNATALRAKTEADYQDAMAKAGQYKVQELSALRTANRDQIDDIFKAYQFQVTEEDRGFRRAERAEDRALRRESMLASAEQRKLYAEQLRERVELKRATQEELEANVQAVNAGRSRFGLPALNQAQVEQLAKGTTKTKAQINSWREIGLSQILDPSSVTLGSTPIDAYATYEMSGVPIPPSLQPAAKLIRDTYATVVSTPGASKDKAVIAQTANNLINQAATQQLSNIKSGDSTNLYAAPTLETIVEAAPAVSRLAVTPILRTAGVELADGTKVLAQVSNAVNSGEIKFQTAVDDLVTLYRAAAATNNSAKDFQALQLPVQDGYQTTVDISGWESYISGVAPLGIGQAAFDSSMKVDMTNSVDVGRALSRRMSLLNRLPGIRELQERFRSPTQ